jgi:hypothetical protein
MVLLRKLQTAWGLAQSYWRGWRCRRKIVIIESDDWGCIRTASREAYDRLLAEGYALDRSHLNLDALETDEDLDRLFNVLGSVRDASGRPACMTANMIMANPDFVRIRQHDFRHYFHEPACRTLARSAVRQGVARRWSEGVAQQVFVPQLHAREHVAWWDWLEALRAGSAEARLTFDLGMCGVPYASSKERRSFYKPVYLDDRELERFSVDVGTLVRDAAALFESQFGHTPLSVAAPNYQWTDRVEGIWWAVGVRYIQGTAFQHLSDGRRRTHYFGQRSPAGQYYLVRNCFLEAAAARGSAVPGCLREIERAFRWHKPAVIGTHRYNYVGAIDPENREEGLRQLGDLLRQVCRRWPDIVFLSSPELGRMIEDSMCR